MNRVGVVICNYNKKNFVCECIQSVLESKDCDFDVFVVDNASTDGSADAIHDLFGDSVNLICNDDNLGGSGGFNTGLLVANEKNYDYFYLLDDDASIDEHAISELVKYMDANPDVGMAGSRVYHRQYPEYIQQCGLMIDFDHCQATTIGADILEDGTLPKVIECDTVATCAVLVRKAAVDKVLFDGTKVGFMPDTNFIYWDDMEWGHRIKLAGYKIVTLASSAVLHQMGANVKRSNTFINYYMWRNRTNFFMKYCEPDKIANTSYQILSSFFDAMYECMFREEHNVKSTISYALYDAMSGVRGKADEYKILDNDANDNKLIDFIKDKKTYYIVSDGFEEDAIYLVNFFEGVNQEFIEVDSKEKADVVFHMCDYIFNVKDLSLNEIYIDEDRNCIVNSEDVMAVSSYEYNKLLFVYLNQDVFISATEKINLKLKGCNNE